MRKAQVRSQESGVRRGLWVRTYKLPTLLEIGAVAVVLSVLISCAVFRIGAAQPRGFDGPAYLKAWNDVGASIDKQNLLFDELMENVKRNQPGRVRSVRRLELLEQIINEHERQLKDFKKLLAAER